jgi:CRP/FNR family cyclic AMP-dependent transcriptional regulator
MDLTAYFAKARNVRTVTAGTKILESGAPADFMYVLLEGSASIVVGSTVVEIAGPGAMIGEMALVDNEARSATVIARTRCRLVPIDPAHFELLIQEQPAFARHVLNVVVDRLRRMNEHLVHTQGIHGVRVRVTAGSLDSVPMPVTRRQDHH